MQRSFEVSDLQAMQIAAMPIDKYRQLIDLALQNASKRSIGVMLKNLFHGETEERKSIFPSILEKRICLRERLTRFLGPEEFDKRYRRLRNQLEREKQIIAKAQAATRRMCSEEQPFVRVRQEAVGHGGLHHGIFVTGRPSIRWVYDCGSWRKAGREALRGCIDDFARRCKRDGNRGIDLLFVSHFDADHVNGIRQLLKAVPGKTKTVVLPYLGEVGAFAVLCEAAARGRCPPALIDQVVDPVRWFQELGAERIIQLRPGAPPLTGEPPVIPELPSPEDLLPSDGIGTDLSYSLVGAGGKPVKMKCHRAGSPSFESAIVSAGAVLGIGTATGKWADWWFVPYVHPIQMSIHTQLCIEAKRSVGVPVGSPMFLERLTRVLKTKSGVKKIKAAYRRAGLKDANGISLSLYTGPRPSQQSKRSILLTNGTRSNKPVGWLLSGDSNLQSFNRRSRWTDFFGSFKKCTGTVMLPHHGSIHNFSREILDCVPSAELFVTADAEDRTRPNGEVYEIVKLYSKKRIRKVSEMRRDAITEISGPNSLSVENFPYPREW
jgi:hypothetical protein